MTLKQMIYQRIITGTRIAAYKTYSEFWYVIEWHKGTYIHYTHKVGQGTAKFLWYLSNTILAPKWPAQTESFEVKGTINTSRQHSPLPDDSSKAKHH